MEQGRPAVRATASATGGAIPEAGQALDAAHAAFAANRDAEAVQALAIAIRALHAAGWVAAERFGESLRQAMAHAADHAALRPDVDAALADFTAALASDSFDALARSDVLNRHYGALNAALDALPPDPARQGRLLPGASREGLALAGRIVPPATLRQHLTPTTLASIRDNFERALLPILRADGAHADAYARLSACMAQARGPGPYDFWRLAGACVAATRAAQDHLGIEGRRVLARCNLLLAEQARGAVRAPASLVRAALTLIWCHRESGSDTVVPADLLLDYGLPPRAFGARPGGSSSDTRGLAHANGSNADRQVEADRGPASKRRRIGALSVDEAPYEAFLDTADASVAALLEHAALARQSHSDTAAGAAFEAATAAYTLGAAAADIGLGGIALQADALGMAWRRYAHRLLDTTSGPPISIVGLEAGAESLRRMLHQVAAGMAPASAMGALAALAAEIEAGESGAPASAAPR